MSLDQSLAYPAQVHRLSPLMTLQGAVAQRIVGRTRTTNRPTRRERCHRLTPEQPERATDDSHSRFEHRFPGAVHALAFGVHSDRHR
jgi:hypothetical protein